MVKAFLARFVHGVMQPMDLWPTIRVHTPTEDVASAWNEVACNLWLAVEDYRQAHPDPTMQALRSSAYQTAVAGIVHACRAADATAIDASAFHTAVAGLAEACRAAVDDEVDEHDPEQLRLFAAR